MNVIFENLTERQQAYRNVCDEFGVEIGEERTSAGEDAALYFCVHNDKGKVCEPESEVARFCLVTVGEKDIHYAYADYGNIEAAMARGVVYIDDDIYAERPVKVIDLDTGEEFWPKFKVEWEKA